MPRNALDFQLKIYQSNACRPSYVQTRWDLL